MEKEPKGERIKQFRFPKGVSPNPGGRPKGTSTLKLLRDAASEPYPGDKQHRTNAQMMVDQLWLKAGQGSIRAADLIFERLEGKVMQAITMTATLETIAREERVEKILDKLETLEGKDSQPRVN